jgi:hypothetical protein
MKDFYGNTIIPLIYTDGTQAKLGDIIRWKVWDNDGWTMTGIYKSSHIVYLGGGCDFGLAIGEVLDVGDVIRESENNYYYDKGIINVGVASELAWYLEEFRNPDND